MVRIAIANCLRLSSPSLALSGEELLRTCEVLLREMKTSPDGRVSVPRDGQPCWFYMQTIQGCFEDR